MTKREWSEPSLGQPGEQVPDYLMYSFNRPSYLVWYTIAGELSQRGWCEDKIIEWLKSKDARWALDGEFGVAIVAAAKKYAEGIKDD